MVNPGKLYPGRLDSRRCARGREADRFPFVTRRWTRAVTVWTVLLAVCLPLGTGPWSAVPAAVAQEVSPELLDEAARRTGLSREELLARYRQRQGTAATDTSASGEPGRTSLDGIDDARLIDSTEQAEERWRDTDAIVELPGTALLESGLLDGLAEDLAVVPGDTVGYFGHDFFRLDEGVFAPPSFGPIGGDHRLGVGDELVINVWGGIDFQLTRIVDRDGAILLPRAGKVVCAGRTLDEVNASVKRQLARSYASIDEDGAAGGDEGDTYVEVTLGQLRAIRVFVIGAVQRPGSYELSSASRVLTALYAAGGPTVSGSLRDIRLLRGQDQIASLDMYRYLLGQGSARRPAAAGGRYGLRTRRRAQRATGRRGAPPPLLRDETGRDPERPVRLRRRFHGRCQRPRGGAHLAHTLPPSARSAGQPDQVLLDIPYDAGRMQAASGRPVLLLDGDLVTVEAITERQDNWVKGHRSRSSAPVPTSSPAGATVLDLLEQVGGLWPDALTERAVLDRTSDTLELSSLTVPLAEIMAGRSPDMQLQPRDELYVFSLWDARERPAGLHQRRGLPAARGGLPPGDDPARPGTEGRRSEGKRRSAAGRGVPVATGRPDQPGSAESTQPDRGRDRGDAGRGFPDPRGQPAAEALGPGS